MATSRQTWSVPGVILFSQGELSYEVDLSRPLVEELAQSRLGERIVPAWERTNEKRLRQVIVRTLPPTSRDPEALDRMRARLREEARLATYLHDPKIADGGAPLMSRPPRAACWCTPWASSGASCAKAAPAGTCVVTADAGHLWVTC
jgi:hypothetical protein